ncbi:hypothetical protein RHSIM_Rhsim13G0177700 [Rhododendron simsii]|uniref:Zinc finger LSD1-type domain-containing protein n=1 Tax=Rhododendron simsii TaxID=118357 RepID=A0A834L6B3_RHOSS|nr:hypothetical protein RHSIM_Rhsim13G0177700 [Rhododendron simsii]
MDEEEEDGAPPGWQSPISKKKVGGVIKDEEEEENGPPPGLQSNPIKQAEIKKEEEIEEEEEEGPPPGWQPIPVKDEEIKEEEVMQEEEEDGPPPGWQPVPVKEEEMEEQDDDDDGPPPGWQSNPIKDEEIQEKGIEEEDDDDGPPPGWQTVPPQLPTPAPPGPSLPVAPHPLPKPTIVSGNLWSGGTSMGSKMSPSVTDILKLRSLVLTLAGRTQFSTRRTQLGKWRGCPLGHFSVPGHHIFALMLIFCGLVNSIRLDVKITICHPVAVKILQRRIKWFVVLAANFFLILEEPGLYNAHAAGQSILFWKVLLLILYPLQNKCWFLPLRLFFSEHQVGQVKCGSCAVLLMYPYGAQSVKCSSCRFVTEIRVCNILP